MQPTNEFLTRLMSFPQIATRAVLDVHGLVLDVSV